MKVMKVMKIIIGFVIDMSAVAIQAPYLLIADTIMKNNCKRNGYNQNVYAWWPTVGFLEYQYTETGKLCSTRIKYKDLFE